MLAALVLAAAVANLNLSVANVELPTIGKAFDASQTQLNLIAVGYSLGLAASVLYLGAVGDRYGRKLMLLVGSACSIPLSVLAANAPSPEILIGARILVTVPFAAAAFAMAWFLVPAHMNEMTKPVDHLGGILSVVMVAALTLCINFVVVPNSETLVIILAVFAAAGLIAFVLRQRRAPNPLYDLHVAGRITFWVAAVAGIIVFGSLMGGMFISCSGLAWSPSSSPGRTRRSASSRTIRKPAHFPPAHFPPARLPPARLPPARLPPAQPILRNPKAPEPSRNGHSTTEGHEHPSKPGSSPGPRAAAD